MAGSCDVHMSRRTLHCQMRIACALLGNRTVASLTCTGSCSSTTRLHKNSTQHRWDESYSDSHTMCAVMGAVQIARTAMRRWAREIADDIKHELKAQGWPRYKYIVHVVIGEQKGEGVRLACRCFWDSNTDALAKETYENKSIFAIASVYGVYYY